MCSVTSAFGLVVFVAILPEAERGQSWSSAVDILATKEAQQDPTYHLWHFVQSVSFVPPHAVPWCQTAGRHVVPVVEQEGSGGQGAHRAHARL